MSRPERFPPDDPREWLNRARSSLAQAKSQIPGVYLEDLCFDAQQAAARAVKAVMIRRDMEFPTVRDLNRLLPLLEEDGEFVPVAIWRSHELTRYAGVTRYPTSARPVSEPEYRQAVAIAQAVVTWAEKHL